VIRSAPKVAAARSGAEIELPTAVVTCHSRNDCGTPLKAGLLIDFTGWECTTGFFAHSPTDGQRYLITAGHCIKASGLYAEWSHHGHRVGRAALDAFEQGTTADAGAIELDGIATANVVLGVTIADLRPITGTRPEADQTVGTEVCRSGGVSGWTCGHVVTVDVDTVIAGTPIRHTWWTDFPSQSGDSGSPLIDRSGHLLGIVIATTSTQTLYSTVDAITDELNLRLGIGRESTNP